MTVRKELYIALVGWAKITIIIAFLGAGISYLVSWILTGLNQEPILGSKRLERLLKKLKQLSKKLTLHKQKNK